MSIGTLLLLHARQWRAGALMTVLLGAQAVQHSSAQRTSEEALPQPEQAALLEEVQPAPPPAEDDPTLEDVLVLIQQEKDDNTTAGKTYPRHLDIAESRIRKNLCESGTMEYCDLPQAKNVDLQRLAYAVAVAETSNCSKGTGVSKNNCHGIMECNRSSCSAKTFANTTQSFIAFQKLWLRAYGDRFPTLADAKRYSGGEGDTWLHRVRSAYRSQP